MPANSIARTRIRSSSNAHVKRELPSNNLNHYHTPLVHHASAVHPPATISTPPLRPTSAAQNGTGMSAASRYAHNLKVLRRRDPSILRIFDQFSHVCVYHHNGECWEKKGFEGSMFLYERADYPPYGFYILNRMGMDDYIQRLWPEDNMSVTGSYLMLRTWPEWSRKRISDIEASNGGKELDPFDERYKWDEETRPNKETELSQTIGLWMFATDSREPLINVMLRLHRFIKQNIPYPEEFRYGPNKPPPPNPYTSSVNGTPFRTASAASSASGVSAASSSHTSSGSTGSQPRSQRHSPNVAYVNPLLYQANESAATAANCQPLEPVVETPKAKGKGRKRKGKGEKVRSESGDVTPMASGSNQTSDLNMLFAKLVQPSEFAAKPNEKLGSSPTSSRNRSSSFLETLMGNGNPVNPAAIPTTMTTSHQPPADQLPTQITLESLFASALSSVNHNEAFDAPKIRNREDETIWNHRQSFPVSFDSPTAQTRAEGALGDTVPITGNSGLALLNDIFASASTSGSIIPPSDSISQDDLYSQSDTQLTSVLPANANTHADEPETIEIYSPRPQAPLSLASMFDAADRDHTSSPTTGLGLDLDSNIEQNAGQGHHILTQQVLETLLKTGGSIDSDAHTILHDGTSNGIVFAEVDAAANASIEVADDEPEEVRKKLLDMIGLGTHPFSNSLYHRPDVNGDATPRVKPQDTRVIEQHSFLASSGAPESFIQSAPHADVPFTDADNVLDEGDEDDEAIVELDFSDTRALSDLHVFETRERQLREQLGERRAASRNASRSTTPAMSSHEQTANTTSTNSRGPKANGVGPKNETLATFNSDSRYIPVVTSVPLALATSSIQVASRKATPPSLLPVSRGVPAPIADAPVTPRAQTSVQTENTGSPSSKKTRRGRGRGKDKGRESKEGSPKPDIPHHFESSANIIGNPTLDDNATLVSSYQKVQVNGIVRDELSASSPSSHINELLPGTEVSSQVNGSLALVLSEREKLQVNNKEELANFAMRLLQTDQNFVKELWYAWKSSSAKPAPVADEKPSPAPTIYDSLAGPSVAAPDHGDEQPAPILSLPHLGLTQSAPANLPTLAGDAGRAQYDHPVSSASLQSGHDHTLSSLIPMVKDIKRIEAERERAPTSGEQNVTAIVEFGDDDESHVVERLL